MVLIQKMIEYNSNNIYYITVNNKGFIDEYNRAYHLYTEIIKKNRMGTEDSDDDIMKKIMDTQDVGKMRDVNSIKKYYEIILLNSKFMFVE
jgi:mannitol-1-phosphate/altronate dehydrogenase